MKLLCSNRSAKEIDSIPSHHASASIHICGRFNIHWEEWLVHSIKTDRECHDFFIAYQGCGWRYSCFRYSRAPRKSFKPLFHHLSWQIFRCNVTLALSPLGFSDNSVICVSVDVKRKTHLLMSHFMWQFFVLQSYQG